MYRRGLHRRYPFFRAYTILQVATSLILAVLLATSYTGYYYGYYCNLVLSTVISFFVLWEIVRNALGRSRRSGVHVFVMLCAAVSMIAVVGLLLVQESHGGGIFTEGMMLTDRALRTFQFLIMLALIFFSQTLELSYKSVTFGISLGFGFFSLTNMLVATALSHHGFLTSVALSEINSLAYRIAVVVWLFYVIFGLDNESGRSRADGLALRDQEAQTRRKPPSRWFFHEGIFGRSAVGGD